ncbi:septum formation protein Maf [Aquimarina sp. BL5]|uniref:Maf-like protein n=1 Tax=Aquimarina sp. BL5 TaxID=1714860 RepID=UPI000E478289|nr:Maf-like protein [Aquimarina sp. BL5]AXT49296.1 septum formation protein Maf [Aquimarina sp. BL5]RKN04041.1 septum formation protein Maf [Aquimarina sp. BL5]
MLKELLKNHNLILASGSPRRQQFFKDLDLDFTIQLKEVNEIYPDHLKASSISDYLAKLKADEFTQLKSNDILVTSDTIVWHHNKAIGKPKDAQDAKNMIASLSGETHEVITSVCFKTATTTEIINQITKVTFKPLTAEEINYYVDTFSPMDKAGAYGIQEWIGYIGITHIEGSYFNVMGLPVQLVYETLMKLAGS